MTEKEYDDISRAFNKWLSASLDLGLLVDGEDKLNDLLLTSRPWNDLHERTIIKMGEMRKALGYDLPAPKALIPEPAKEDGK